eukprot:m.480586 g.480586  ORF g.480586 m.480586 type:complete len:102 (+) comp21707_c0_seq41:1204-1509(+)
MGMGDVIVSVNSSSTIMLDVDKHRCSTYICSDNVVSIAQSLVEVLATMESDIPAAKKRIDTLLQQLELDVGIKEKTMGKVDIYLSRFKPELFAQLMSPKNT